MELLDEKEKFSKRLTQAAIYAALHYYGMYSDLARMFRMTPRGVQKWFIAEAMPRSDKIDALASYYQVRSEWLRSNRGPMREVIGVDSDGLPESIMVTRVPILAPVDIAGVLSGDKIPDGDRVVVTGPLPPKAYAIRLHDNALGDYATKGMCLVVDAQRQPSPDEVGVVLVDDSVITGHVIKRDQYMLIPPNPSFPPVSLGASPIIGGTVISVAQRSFAQPPTSQSREPIVDN